MLNRSPIGVKVMSMVQSRPMIDIYNQGGNFDVLCSKEAHIDGMKLSIVDKFQVRWK